jgi:hypothetical protein
MGMETGSRFALNGPLSRHLVPRRELLVAGRRYRVWLRIASIAQGKVCVWVGGNRTGFFATPGEHVEEVAAGSEQAVAVQGINAAAVIEAVAVKELRG